MKNTVVLFHSADWDGQFCYQIAKRHFGDTAEYIGWDFGDPVPFVPHHVDLYILDLSIESLMRHPKLVWIDHHGSAIAKYPDNITGYRIDGVAACRLAWQFFNGICIEKEAYGVLLPNGERTDYAVVEPLAVRLAGEYDVWDKRTPDAEVFQFGLDAYGNIEWDELFQGPDHTADVHRILNAGRFAKSCFEKRDADTFKLGRGFTVNWEGLTFLCLNAARCNSNTFKSAVKPEHDALLAFFFNGKEWTFSLYGVPHRPDLDLSAIAIKHGGGGHRQACGFKSHHCAINEILEIIQPK